MLLKQLTEQAGIEIEKLSAQPKKYSTVDAHTKRASQSDTQESEPTTLNYYTDYQDRYPIDPQTYQSAQYKTTYQKSKFNKEEKIKTTKNVRIKQS